MSGNPVAYRNLYRHLNDILNYLEISLDSDFILEELHNALYESESVFGKKHQFSTQIRMQFDYLYKKYIERKALPLEEKDEKNLKEKILQWLQKYYKKPLV